MKKRYKTILYLAVGCEIFAHGRSPELEARLNSAVPEWMSIAEPIKVYPSTKNLANIDRLELRDISGGATNSKNSVYIVSKNFNHQFDYAFARGRNSVSLSPNGWKLLINQRSYEPSIRVYEIDVENKLKEIQVMVPNITYDKGLKGFISTWYWASDEVLLGKATINDDTGHDLVESRLYAYNLNTKSLARLDLSALNIDIKNYISIESVGKNLSELVISIGGNTMIVEADLKSHHTILETGYSNQPEEVSATAPTIKSLGGQDATQAIKKSNLLLIILGISFLAAIIYFWFKILKGKPIS